MDANGNGKIELREFLNWYSKQLQKKNQTAQDDVRCATYSRMHMHTHARIMLAHMHTTTCICSY